MSEKNSENLEVLEFVFRGKKFECVPAKVMNYKLQKAISCGATNPVGYYNALSAMFNGKDEEYADMIGGSMEDMGELYTAAVNAVGAKN